MLRCIAHREAFNWQQATSGTRGIGRAVLRRMSPLEQANNKLKNIVSDLSLNKATLLHFASRKVRGHRGGADCCHG